MNKYLSLTKPGIIGGNILTYIAGFLIASKGLINLTLFCTHLLGLALIIAAGCVFNNYIDREIDKTMERTKNRHLVKGIISNTHALFFGMILYLIGNLFLVLNSNVITVFLANLGFIIYVFIYSFLKNQSTYATAIGSISGSIPPLVGYCSVTGKVDLGALLLFLMMVFWQMPHFFSIAILHQQDYTKAGYKALPITKGLKRTKIHMFFYILGFILALFLLTYNNYTGNIFLLFAMTLSFIWLGLCLKGFLIKDEKIWGKKMFHLSLIIITTICFSIPFDFYFKF